MRKKFRRFMHDTAGSGGYIDLAVFLIVFVGAIAFSISASGSGWHKTSAQDMASYAARQISADGAFSGTTIQQLSKIAGNNNFSIRVQTSDGYDATVPISSSQTSLATEEIQYGNSFTVAIYAAKNDAIGIGGVGVNSVSIAGFANGVSQKYWKS